MRPLVGLGAFSRHLSGPGSMPQHRFQNLIRLLALLQLLLPSGSPWLHTVFDSACCESKVGCASPADVSLERTSCAHSHSHCCDHFSPQNGGNSGHGHHHSDHDSRPHNCANCAVCQAIAAPRILSPVVVLPTLPEVFEALVVASCADPLLGFGLPPQCRAPPAIS